MADEKVKVVLNGQSMELDKDIITKGIEKGEVEIKDENILVFAKPDYETRIENLKKEEYKKGRKEGVEIEWKETKRKLGLEIEGKNGDEILDAFQKKILADAKIEPSKKIQELEADKIKLQSNLTKLEQEKTELSNSFAQKEKESKVNSRLFQIIPDKAVTEHTTRNDISILFKGNGYSLDYDGDKEIAKFNGEIIKHPVTLEPVPVTDVMAKFVTDKGLIKNEGGRGAGDDTGGSTPGTLEAFTKEMELKGFKVGSEAYAKEMGVRIANKTLKV